MAVICPICYSTPSIRGAVDADIVRKISLSNIAERHKLSIRSVRRHLKHLPKVLETERVGPSTVVIAPVYNINLVVSPSAEEASLETRALLGDLEEEGDGEGVA